ncbi:hypothetical protein LEN26_013658 [Aphanomyces euteiches]|nr:hypothetical protein LEN26_013658 [Aphanomyces euteiches]KAH9125029.1 hypothetical protein AeMF1_004294 [Aphanomyces euteiches]
MKTPLAELVAKTDSNNLLKQRQVKAKNDPLKTSFYRLNPESMTNNVLRDLINSIKRSQRIANCLGGRIANEFSYPELEQIIEETEGILLTIS